MRYVWNTNGKDLKSLCKINNLVPVNHLQRARNSFDGALTFRRRSNWISQLDWTIMSSSLIDHIHSYHILQDTDLPTDHAALVLHIRVMDVPASCILSCANQLGVYTFQETSMTKKAIKANVIDTRTYVNNLPHITTIWNHSEEMDIHQMCELLSQTLYETAQVARVKRVAKWNVAPANATNRWKNILSHNNDRELWSAINWNGTLITDIGNEKPTDGDFCSHFETLLNQSDNENLENYVPETVKYIPILDDFIRPDEVEKCIRELKPNKAAGVDGISPGLLKMLPYEWTVLLTHTFNKIFVSGCPLNWTFMKMFTIFKKGSRQDPQNYRGISVISALPKLYDMVLSNRLTVTVPYQDNRNGRYGYQNMATAGDNSSGNLRVFID